MKKKKWSEEFKKSLESLTTQDFLDKSEEAGIKLVPIDQKDEEIAE